MHITKGQIWRRTTNGSESVPVGHLVELTRSTSISSYVRYYIGGRAKYPTFRARDEFATQKVTKSFFERNYEQVVYPEQVQDIKGDKHYTYISESSSDAIQESINTMVRQGVSFSRLCGKTATLQNISRAAWNPHYKTTTAEFGLTEWQRVIDKQIRHAFNYGMGAYKLNIQYIRFNNKEDTNMSKELIETRTFINGHDARELSDADIVEHIDAAQKKVKRLEDMRIASKKVQVDIKSRNEAIDALIKFLDGRADQ